MKKAVSFFATVISLVLLQVCGYATPASADGEIVISRIDAVEYVIIVGAGIFLIGMLFVLLSIHSGGKKADEYDDVEENDFKEIEEEPACEDSFEETETKSVENEQILEETETKSIENEEILEEAEELAPETEADEDFREEIADEENAEEIIEEELSKVRITLTGTNNSDVRIAEFRGSATLGRRADNDIVISDNAVSGSHCIFTYEDGILYIEDCNSTNGTLLNGEMIEKAEIKTGDSIILGQHQYKINIIL